MFVSGWFRVASSANAALNELKAMKARVPCFSARRRIELGAGSAGGVDRTPRRSVPACDGRKLLRLKILSGFFIWIGELMVW